MKTREERIAWEMDYCQHYGRGKGAEMICKCGMDRDKVQVVPVGPKRIKWGPCIKGHTLEDPRAHCPNWIRRTREMGEARADSIERSIDIMTKVMPFISDWRSKGPMGKREVVECPVCKGGLMLSQASYNGHVHAHCSTQGCVSFME